MLIKSSRIQEVQRKKEDDSDSVIIGKTNCIAGIFGVEHVLYLHTWHSIGISSHVYEELDLQLQVVSVQYVHLNINELPLE